MTIVLRVKVKKTYPILTWMPFRIHYLLIKLTSQKVFVNNQYFQIKLLFVSFFERFANLTTSLFIVLRCNINHHYLLFILYYSPSVGDQKGRLTSKWPPLRALRKKAVCKCDDTVGESQNRWNCIHLDKYHGQWHQVNPVWLCLHPCLSNYSQVGPVTQSSVLKGYKSLLILHILT